MTPRRRNGASSVSSKSMSMSLRAAASKRLKLSGKVSAPKDISTRKQVGETEAMLESGGERPYRWWRNVGLEEGM